jgi:hypothetical protein
MSLRSDLQRPVDRARALVRADSQGIAALAGHLGTADPHDAEFFAAAYGAAIVRLVTLLGVIDQLVRDRDLPPGCAPSR